MDKKQEHLNSKHIDSSEVCPNYMDSNEYNANDAAGTKYPKKTKRCSE